MTRKNPSYWVPRLMLDAAEERATALRAEIERLRAVLADIKCGAVNITMAKQMAARALEPKP